MEEEREWVILVKVGPTLELSRMGLITEDKEE
jgi:hypothetical protein